MSNDSRTIQQAGTGAKVRARRKLQYDDVLIVEETTDGWYRCIRLEDGTSIELHGTCPIVPGGLS